MDTIILIIQYESSRRYIHSKGKIIAVQEGDGEPRPPTNPDPDAAYRWLAANGYEPVPAEFEFLAGDWPGMTTFRPRKKQVYRKAHQQLGIATVEADRSGVS